MNAFVLTLDTAAPEIAWQPPAALTGGTFDVPYALDEPSLVSAALRDEAGNTYPVAIQPDRLTGAVPAGARGLRIEADVLDQVGNAAVRTLALTIKALRTRVRAFDRLKTVIHAD